MSHFRLPPSTPGRRRAPHRRKSWSDDSRPIVIRIGSRHSRRKYIEVTVTGPHDARRFAREVDAQVSAHPRDPLIVCVDGYQPWLETVLSACVQDYWQDISDLGRETLFASTSQFPEQGDPLQGSRGGCLPWTYIVDEMNVPQVYYWSVGLEPPFNEADGLPDVSQFRFRIGVWQMGRGACRYDENIPVVIIFTKPKEVNDFVVAELLFDYLYKDHDLSQPREDEEGVCWLFLRLYWLLTDWENIIAELLMRLGEADANSHGSHLPVKLRARMMHKEVDRIYELKQYLAFHTRAFGKLQKLKDDVPKSEQGDPLWGDLDDTLEDLKQFDGTIDGIKERFNNLLDLEFNIQSAEQSDNSQYLSIIATLFLPVSYLASVFGITTITWPPIWYLYIAIPVLVLSAIFTASFTWAVHRIQRVLYPSEKLRVPLSPRSFTMLGDELPDSANISGASRVARTKKKGARPGGVNEEDRSRAPSRSRSKMRNEKDDY